MRQRRQCRLDIVPKMLTTFNDDPDLLKKAISGDESFSNHPKGKRFATIEDIKEKSKQEDTRIPKSSLQKCFEYWKKRWHKCIIFEGGYFTRGKIK